MDAIRVGGLDIEVFRRQPDWSDAVARIRAAFAGHEAEVRERVRAFHARYRGRRAAMVFDVLHSANRRYDSVVVPRVEAFEDEAGASSLRAMAQIGPATRSGFRRGERAAMMQLAGALADFCDEEGLGDDGGCARWASSLELGTHFDLDPVIGRIKYLAATQYPYLRMRAGADDVKPDRRVAKELRGIGIRVSDRPTHVHLTARAVAMEAGIRPIELDQLLWFGIGLGAAARQE